MVLKHGFFYFSADVEGDSTNTQPEKLGDEKNENKTPLPFTPARRHEQNCRFYVHGLHMV